LALSSFSAAFAQPAPAPGPLSGAAFLLGTWTSTSGTVSGKNQSARGTSSFTSEAGGAAMLRRDHTDLFDASGKALGGFDQIMLVYANGADIDADYTDGTHVIHYTSATVVPNTSVTFATGIAADRPAFRLTYRLTAPGALSVRFEMAAPGGSDFHDVATGTLVRS
jgi:hypothetical protein